MGDVVRPVSMLPLVISLLSLLADRGEIGLCHVVKTLSYFMVVLNIISYDTIRYDSRV